MTSGVAMQREEALPVRLERDGAVARITLDRPERGNSFDDGMVETLHHAIDAAIDAAPSLIVVQGAGKAFCTGFDLSGLDEQSDADLLLRFVRIELLLQKVFHAPCLTLALAHGKALGAGADLFAACDIRIAAPGTSFRMPGWRFGLALGTRRLALRIGADRAREILAGAKAFGAEQALTMGFATAVAGSDMWFAMVDSNLKSLAGVSGEAAEHLGAILKPDTRDADLAALVRSAARSGIRQRIEAFAANALRSPADKANEARL